MPDQLASGRGEQKYDAIQGTVANKLNYGRVVASLLHLIDRYMMNHSIRDTILVTKNTESRYDTPHPLYKL